MVNLRIQGIKLFVAGKESDANLKLCSGNFNDALKWQNESLYQKKI
jgi:hypothetical protein